MKPANMMKCTHAMARIAAATLLVATAWCDPCPANDPSIEARLSMAGDNRSQLEKAIREVPARQKEAIEFLVLHMPDEDLKTLSCEYLLENCGLAHEAVSRAPWGASIPREIFLNDVLPYASINERRDEWRADFRERCLPMIKDISSASRAAAKINQELFAQIGVRYSTKRKKADQSPYESMESGLASCTGLSVILVDACRSVGIPARLVGTPLWWNGSGNHSWVEIWDGGWRFTGAAEPTGDELDRGWFLSNASKAVRNHPLKAIYATSFKSTPLHFPCVWAPRLKSIPAVNVTERYGARTSVPEGMTEALFVVRDSAGTRISTKIEIKNLSEPKKTTVKIETNDEGFDANDHTRVRLIENTDYEVILGGGNLQQQERIHVGETEELFEFVLATDPNAISTNKPRNPSALESLEVFLRRPRDEREPITQQDFAKMPLTRVESERAIQLLAEDRLEWIRATRSEEMDQRVLVEGEHRMPFDYKVFGEKPKDGRSLYISMHGGGGAPKAVNDRQWENQKRLYEPAEGVYIAPRAPTDTWNLWHQSHIDPLFIRLIENLVAFEDVRWDRVYLMGYSAGGDGVYQLAPRMADRWAAAAMMAGHPNETSPLGLRNVPFILQMGGRDSAYKRNQIAVDWKLKLAELRVNDPGGYMHLVKIYPEHGHWMNRDDAIALPWMSKFKRGATPNKIVWVQDDVLHKDFYWLGVDAEEAKKGAIVKATVDGQQIKLESESVGSMTVYLNDELLNLDEQVTIQCGGRTLFSGQVPRTIGNLAQQLQKRADPNLCFPGSVRVKLRE